MKIATGDTSQAYGAGFQQLDGVVCFSGRGENAERKHRQIIEALWACDKQQDIDDVLRVHSLEIDALYLDYPEYHAAVEETVSEVTALIRASGQSGAPDTAQSSTTAKQEKIVMFATNQTEGSQGPWMTWSSNGSAAKGFAPKSWVMRGKDANDNKFEQVFEGFANPCVFDLDSLKLGWEKDGAQGQAPERRYSSHYSQAMPRPDESKKPNGAFTWSCCLQVRVATSQTQAVTWEQGSFGAYQAFVKLSKLIEAQWSEHSQNGALLPVVQMTGVEERSLTSGTTNIPILEIVKWVPRPDILKDDAPQIAAQPAQAAASTTPAPAAAQTPPPTTQPDNSAVSAAGGF
ncbi:hypothetical protein [uncultured Ruegeria sp.]|uniref:hypothetical protein n=1 Tax=uncultured Ruegeria sp. TaxID=259304 RepID=UPI0026078723|nr:hypothetical protein [uncultured Ruegeria sp.]